MPTDRRRSIEVRLDGSLFDHAVMRMWLDQSDDRAKRPTVARLSASDPEISAFEATSRGVRAAA